LPPAAAGPEPNKVPDVGTDAPVAKPGLAFGGA
jgi:hypothetical protein